MKLLVFSDVHGDYAALERLMELEAEYYFAAGDLVSWGRGLDRCGDILRRRAGRVYVLPGNHEWDTQVAEFCRRYGLYAFHEQSFEAGGYYIAGFGYSNLTPFHTPGEYTEDEIGRRLSMFAPLKPLILICHCPPLGTALDRVRKGVHPGSRAVRDFIERYQPEYFACGHIHEAEGVTERIGRTLCVNAGKRGHLLDVAVLAAASR